MNVTLEDRIQLLVTVNLEAFWPRLPIYLVWVSGLVVAWRKRHQHPRVQLAMLAIGGLLLESLVGTFVGTVLAGVAHSWGWNRESLDGMLTTLAVFENCFVALMWVLLLTAVFDRRSQDASVA